ncbi:site-specific tyrosine recombinase XerC [Streptomyces sp. ADI96-15]|uniref:site-specific integrase n=1 Tax=Streptomyces sp. ADI96-15 TaxID=1522761 RepID=UPI000F54F29A|nr:site-specific integrase [Streptomyces sp. ADI96-15]RPK69051.1 site-specific tyrosine recombinase XerC [Streptomyces sp. ADI96-15]
MKGSTYRRCYCRDDDGRSLGAKCPQLSSRRHGVWAVRQELPARDDGTRRSFSRSGYETAKEAQADLDKVRALLDLPDGNDADGQVRLGDLLEQVSKDKKAPLPDLNETRRRFRAGQALVSSMTVGDWLDEWHAAKKRKKSTLRGYASHIDVHLKPGIGHLLLDRLNVGHLTEFFDAIDTENETIEVQNQQRREQQERATWGKRSRPPASETARLAAERDALAAMPPYRRVTGAATQQRIRATLRAALNAAISQQLLTFNPAAHVELASGRRPKAVLWTEEHVARWRMTGEKPSGVMVWTPVQVGEFLDHAEADRLYALFHLIAFRGLRRGEAVGQAWSDIDLDKALLTVSKTIIQDGWTPVESDPKTEDSKATIALGPATVQVLRDHRARQAAERAERLEERLPWADTGKVFVDTDGGWLHPEKVSDVFRRLCREADLPPINLRDLRHVAATLIHAGGGDIHTIKETLRHGTIQLASDTYTSLLPQVDQEVARAAESVVPRARRPLPSDTAAHASLTQEGAES